MKKYPHPPTHLFHIYYDGDEAQQVGYIIDTNSVEQERHRGEHPQGISLEYFLMKWQFENKGERTDFIRFMEKEGFYRQINGTDWEGERPPLKIMPTFGSVWEFYEYVGYDYKTKEYKRLYKEKSNEG